MTDSFNVAICIPSLESWPADFAISLLQMKEHATRSGIEARLLNIRSSHLLANRHLLVRQALSDPKTTHILFLDSDMTFPEDTLGRLLARRTSVVGAMCSTRESPLRSNVLLSRQELNEGVWHNWASPSPKGELVECEAIGTAILLIEADLFRQIPPPWFMFEYDPHAASAYGSEDVFLCQRLRAAGKQIWADLSFSYEIRHVGAWAYGFREPRTA